MNYAWYVYNYMYTEGSVIIFMASLLTNFLSAIILCMCTANQPDHFKTGSYGPVICMYKTCIYTCTCIYLGSKQRMTRFSFCWHEGQCVCDITCMFGYIALLFNKVNWCVWLHGHTVQWPEVPWHGMYTLCCIAHLATARSRMGWVCPLHTLTHSPLLTSHTLTAASRHAVTTSPWLQLQYTFTTPPWVSWNVWIVHIDNIECVHIIITGILIVVKRLF